MTNILVAACLGLLTLLRIPAIWNPPARPALLASAFATAGFTLYIEPVYNAFDSLLGGRNVTGLALSLFVITAFLQLHIAVTSAAGASTQVPTYRRRWITQRHKVAWMVCSLALVAGFALSDLPVTSQSLLRTYGNQPGMVLFLLAASAFIAYTSFSIIRTVISHLGEMSAVFRAGFFLVCAGCFGAIALLGVRSLLQVVADPTVQAAFSHVYGIGQAVAVICVAAGLSASRLVVSARVLFLDVAARWHLLRVLPLWRAVTEGMTNMVLDGRKFRYKDIFCTGPAAALQRRVTEIRDCQLVDPHRCRDAWLTYESSLINAERMMKLSTTAAGTNASGRTTT
jgi:hypothetical protein